MEVYIKDIAYHLPQRVVTNEELVEEFPEWSVEKIAEKVGILERHVAAEGETATDLAVNAAEKLFEKGNVKKEDIPAYARQIGIGLIITGAGIFFTGLLDLAGSSFWWVAMMTGFILGLAIIYKAQKKYNGSVMN